VGLDPIAPKRENAHEKQLVETNLKNLFSRYRRVLYQCHPLVLTVDNNPACVGRCLTVKSLVRADKSVLYPATAQTTSLRVTVPAFVVAKLKLQKGNRFRWHLASDNKIMIEVITN
jgi:hypothetical protein